MLGMARQLRIQYEGAIYHLLSRGDRREEIFRDDAARRSFLETLGAACEKTGWQVHAYCLMSNHFYLVLETPQSNAITCIERCSVRVRKRRTRRGQLCAHFL